MMVGRDQACTERSRTGARREILVRALPALLGEGRLERTQSHIGHRPNLVPSESAHTVVSNSPFGSCTSTVAGPVKVFPVTSTVNSPAMIDQPVRMFWALNVKDFMRNA